MNKNATSVRKNGTNKLLGISFVEGACVMVAELAGGKMLAPFYGTSLYVWASTLAITLGGLAIGYYVGGEWSKFELSKRNKYLLFTLLISSSLVMIMPAWANAIMQMTMEMSFLTGLVLSQLLFLLPPILGFGIVSPMLIGLIAENKESGKAAGLVYAISTLGGVLSTLITGFLLVPLIGISIPCVVMGALLFILTVIILKPRQKLAIAAIILFALPSVAYVKNMKRPDTDKFKVVYHREGIMGQVKILDFIHRVKGKDINTRCMFVNNNWQTWIDVNNPDFSFLYYTRYSKALISTLKPGSSALLIGLGGGTVARQLEQQNVSYDAVEIDGRLPGLAEKYFGLKHAVANTVIDDGRHYINVSKKKYDLIIIDALLGENIPSHLLSYEAFLRLKQLLQTGGKIFIEFDGIPEGSNGTAQYALYNTIKKAGYDCRVFTSMPESRAFDMMYILTKDKSALDYMNAEVVSDFYYPIYGQLQKFELDMTNDVAAIITDDNPSLDFHLRERMLAFRRDFMGGFMREFSDDGVPSFF